MTIELVPNLDEAIDFLKHWHGDRAVLLSASMVDEETHVKGRFDTRLFKAPVDWVGVREFIRVRQMAGNWGNIYFAVNAARGEPKQKMGNADVEAMVTLHVDCDVGPGEDQTEGVNNIISRLQHYKIPPSDIVVSGGGAQGYWKLAAPVPVEGSIQVAEDLKNYNRQIERDLQGDHCHDLARIMRVPGTINIPDEKKTAKGRVPAMAKWQTRSDTTYDLGRFEKAPPESKDFDLAPEGTFSDTGVYETIDVNDIRLNNVGREWVVLGHDGDTKGEYVDAGGKTDRSRMALAVVTACMRAGLDDQFIASLIMDPGWKFGEQVRDKGKETGRQLRRLIMRGHKFVNEDVTKPPVIGSNWMVTANKFIARVMPDLRWYQEEWFIYRNGVYWRKEPGYVTSAVRKWLATCVKYNAKAIAKKKEDEAKSTEGEAKQKPAAGANDDTPPMLIPYEVDNDDVSQMMGALHDLCYVDRDDQAPPCWLYDADERPDPRDCINFRNGILHVPSRELIEHTPEFFTTSISDFEYDPQAQCPLWLETMNNYWPSGDDARMLEIMLLQEMMGYALTPRRDLQKLFATVGPTRSGKGTISRILEILVGPRNCAGPTLDALGTEFGKQSMIGKYVAIIGEAAFGARGDRVAVTNTLKTISGQDAIEINRKNDSYWYGRMPILFWMNCNKTPSFEDAGRALAARLIVLTMTISFEDNPDEQLTEKLKAEAPGIMNWCLQGYDRLYKERHGRFTVTEASTTARENFARMANPLMAFIEDCCVLERGEFTSEDDLWTTYEVWCEKNGQKPGRKNTFIEGLVHSATSLATMQKGGRDEPRVRVMTGIKLRGPAPKSKVDRKTEAVEKNLLGVPF